MVLGYGNGSAWLLSSAGVFSSLLWVAPTFAQITPDSSLGAESSIVTPGTVQGLPADLIEGGAARGANLFHSFSDFNVNAGQSVYFANPVGIENILSRVTGGSISNIDGLLGVDGAANLFLLNPNGVVFGPDASLDISGSFVTSTGSSFAFADGSTFDAAPAGNPLLTVSVPIGVQFNDQPQGDITNQGNLAVGAGETLTLFGDTVVSSGALQAEGGTVQLLGTFVGLVDQATVEVSSANGGGTVLVGGEYLGQGLVPTARRTFVGADVVITADALDSGNGGRVIVWADEATSFAGSISAQGGMQSGDGGFVEVSGLQSLDFVGMVNTQAINGNNGQLLLDPADIVIANTALLGAVPPSAGVFTDFFYSASEDPGQNSHITPSTVEFLLAFGDLTLEATDTIRVADDVNASSSNSLTLRAPRIGVFAVLQQSGGGDLILETPQTAGNFVLVDGGDVNTNVLSGTSLNGGSLRITTHDLFTRNSAQVRTTTQGQGNSGLLQINATGEVDVNSSFIDSAVAGGAVGNSGGLAITANTLSVQNNARVSATTFGQGNSGLLRIDAASDITVESSAAINSAVGGGGVGNSGGITITTGTLSVKTAASVSTSTSERGNAGPLRINARDKITVNGSGSFLDSGVRSGAVGNAGEVAITTNILSVENGAAVNSGTAGRGNSGLLRINAADEITIDFGVISSEVVSGAVGNSGGIAITTDNLSVRNGSNISASTFGQGNSGLLRIDARDNVTVDRSFIFSAVAPGALGNSGGVAITTDNLSVRNGSNVSASTLGQGNSGLLRIDARDNITVDGSGSFALLSSEVRPGALGNSGGIAITTNTLSVRNSAEVVASTLGRGNAGDIAIQSNNDDLNIDLINVGSILAVADSTDIDPATNSPFRSGNITVRAPGTLTIQGLGGLAVSSTASNTGPAGNLNIFANATILDNGVELSAQTASGLGGSINFFGDALAMRRGSLINARSTSTAQTSVGGNITINTSFLLSPFIENNDIIAIADAGSGGRIEVNALSILGFTQSDEPILSVLTADPANNVSASAQSGNDGTVEFNSLELDPSQGITELPADLSDRSNQITPGCGIANTDDGSSFVVTGRGGLPPNPSDPIAANDIEVDWLTYDGSDSTSSVQPPNANADTDLTQAQAMVIDPDGTVHFVVDAAATEQLSLTAPRLCALTAQH